MREISRDRFHRNENKPDSYAFDPRKRCVVSAKEAAEECKLKNINPLSLKFICLGKSMINGEKCGAILTLCSANRNNIKAPYFAHRGNQKGHIEYCDCATDYQTVELIKTLPNTVGKINIRELLKKITTEQEQKKGDVEIGISSEKGNKTITIKEKSDEDSEPVQEFVDITNIKDLYLALANTVKNGNEECTATGERAEDILINNYTIKKYRKGELALEGVKLVVASSKNLNPDKVKKIKECVEGAFWVLQDGCDRGRSEPKIYYVLCSNAFAVKTKYMKMINPLVKNDKKLLIFGYCQKQECGLSDAIVCKINIRDVKGRQMKALTSAISKED